MAFKACTAQKKSNENKRKTRAAFINFEYKAALKNFKNNKRAGSFFFFFCGGASVLCNDCSPTEKSKGGLKVS